MRGAIAVAVAVGAAVCLAPASTDACIHPKGGDGVTRVSQEGQQALALFDGQTEHLVVKIEYRADQPLAGLGIVTPVPAVPRDYGTADPELFERLDQWVALSRGRPAARSRGGGGGGGAERSPLRMLPAAEAGPYRIQPLQASGEAGVVALREWMAENDYAPIPAEALSYYAERAWTFLAVRVDPAEGAQTLSASGGLPPLRVSFPTDRIVYPLRLEAQGTFPVRLYVVTPEPLPDDAFRGATAKGFELAGSERWPSPGRLRSRVDDFEVARTPDALQGLMRELGEPFAEGTHHLRVLYARRFGAGAADPRTWDEELAIPPPPDGARIEGVATAEPEEPAAAEEPAEPRAEATEEEAEEPAAGAAAEDADGCDGCATSRGGSTAALPVAMAALLLVGRARRARGR